MVRKKLTLEQKQKRRPRSLLDIQSQFPTEQACAEFLFKRRWPDGFVCPHCGSGRAAQLKSRAWTYECLDCRRQTSITAGTVMHRSKLPLRTWFWGAHLVAIHSNGISALQLKTQLKVRYPTAWLMLHKFRRAMVAPDRQKLRGVVEIDQAKIPFRTDDQVLDPKGDQMITIIGAVEVVDNITGLPQKRPLGARYIGTRAGRIRLARLNSESARDIRAFIRANVARRSVILTDGHTSYPGIKGYVHDPRTVGSMAGHVALPWVHRVFSLLKRWGLGTYHGFRIQHIDRYLNEFVFRFNRRAYRIVSFEQLLGLAARHPPASYWDIIQKENPRKHDRPLRRRPRRRRTAYGMRHDPPKTPAIRVSDGKIRWAQPRRRKPRSRFPGTTG